MSRISKPIETKSRLMVGRKWETIALGALFLFGITENILKLMMGDGCTTLLITKSH